MPDDNGIADDGLNGLDESAFNKFAPITDDLPPEEELLISDLSPLVAALLITPLAERIEAEGATCELDLSS